MWYNSKTTRGSFRAGFFSGLSSALDIGIVGYGTIVGRTVIMAVVGGTASALGGGKFANGAMSGAFVHLFNAEVYSKLLFSDSHYRYEITSRYLKIP